MDPPSSTSSSLRSNETDASQSHRQSLESHPHTSYSQFHIPPSPSLSISSEPAVVEDIFHHHEESAHRMVPFDQPTALDLTASRPQQDESLFQSLTGMTTFVPPRSISVESPIPPSPSLAQSVSSSTRSPFSVVPSAARKPLSPHDHLQARIQRSATVNLSRINVAGMSSPPSAVSAAIRSPPSSVSSSTQPRLRSPSFQNISPLPPHSLRRPTSLRVTTPESGLSPVSANPPFPSMPATTIQRRPSQFHSHSRHQRAPSTFTPTTISRPSLLMRRSSLGPLTSTHHHTHALTPHINMTNPHTSRAPLSTSRPSVLTHRPNLQSIDTSTSSVSGTVSSSTTSISSTTSHAPHQLPSSPSLASNLVDSESTLDSSSFLHSPHFNPEFTRPTQHHHARFASLANQDSSRYYPHYVSSSLLVDGDSAFGDEIVDPHLVEEVLTLGEEIDLGESQADIQREQRIQMELKRRWQKECIFVYIFFLILVSNYDGGTIPAILINLKRDFPDVTYSALGGLASLNVLGLLIGGVVSGPMLERLNQGRLLGTVIGLQSIAIFLFSLIHQFGSLMMMRFMIGVFQAPLVVFAPVWARVFAPNYSIQQSWLTLIHAATPVGILIGYMVGIITCIRDTPLYADDSHTDEPSFNTVSNYNWQWAFFIQSFILFSLSIPMFFIPKQFLSTRTIEENPTQNGSILSSPTFTPASLSATQSHEHTIIGLPSVEIGKKLSLDHSPLVSIRTASSPTISNAASTAPASSVRLSHRPSPTYSSSISSSSTILSPSLPSSQWQVGVRGVSDGSTSAALAANTTTYYQNNSSTSPSSLGVIEVTTTPSALNHLYPTDPFDHTVNDWSNEVESIEPSIFDSDEVASIFSTRHRVVSFQWTPDRKNEEIHNSHRWMNASLWDTNSSLHRHTWRQYFHDWKEHITILLSNSLYVGMVLSLCCLYFLLGGMHFWVTAYLMSTYSPIGLSMVGVWYVVIIFISSPFGVLFGRHSMRWIEKRLDDRYDREANGVILPPPFRSNAKDADHRTGALYDTIGRKTRQLTKQIFAFILLLAGAICIISLFLGLSPSYDSPTLALLFVFLILLLGGALVPCCSWILDGAMINISSSTSISSMKLSPSTSAVTSSSSFLLTGSILSQQSMNLLGYFLAPIAIGGTMDSGGVTTGFQFDLIASILLFAGLSVSGVLQWRECAHQRTLEDVQRAVEQTIGTQPTPSIHLTRNQSHPIAYEDNPALSPRFGYHLPIVTDQRNLGSVNPSIASSSSSSSFSASGSASASAPSVGRLKRSSSSITLSNPSPRNPSQPLQPRLRHSTSSSTITVPTLDQDKNADQIKDEDENASGSFLTSVPYCESRPDSVDNVSLPQAEPIEVLPSPSSVDPFQLSLTDSPQLRSYHFSPSQAQSPTSTADSNDFYRAHRIMNRMEEQEEDDTNRVNEPIGADQEEVEEEDDNYMLYGRAT